MSDITTQVYRPLADGEYQMVRNSVIIKGSELIASYRGGTLTVELTDNIRLCVLETDTMPGPDWDTAPEWANWWAADPAGWTCWYEQEPVMYLTDNYSGWVVKTINGYQQGHDLEAPSIDIPLGIDWRLLKQQRPKVTA